MHASKMRRVIVALVLILAGTIIVHAGLLDGTKLKVRAIPDQASADKGAKEFNDELIFANDTCTSTNLLRKGFTPSKYHAEAEPNEAEFEAELASATNGVATWTGEIRGTNTLGGLVWSRKDGTNFIYNFTGTKQ